MQQINNSNNIKYTTIRINKIILIIWLHIHIVHTYRLKRCGNFQVIYQLQQEHLKEKKDIINKRHYSKYNK